MFWKMENFNNIDVSLRLSRSKRPFHLKKFQPTLLSRHFTVPSFTAVRAVGVLTPCVHLQCSGSVLAQMFLSALHPLEKVFKGISLKS